MKAKGDYIYVYQKQTLNTDFFFFVFQVRKITSFWDTGKMKGDPFTKPVQLAVKL